MSKRGPRLRGGDHKGSDRSKHSRSPGYKPGDNWLVCDVCGCHVYSSDACQRWDGMVVCKQDWEPRHEQDFVRARKDNITPGGLIRPEPEDDFTTIPGISGPDPIPPPSTDFIHNFYEDKMGKFSYKNDGPYTTFDEAGRSVTLGNNVPPLAGYAYTGNTATDTGHGRGLHELKGRLATTEAPLGSLPNMPETFANNFSMQVIGVMMEPMPATPGQSFYMSVFNPYSRIGGEIGNGGGNMAVQMSYSSGEYYVSVPLDDPETIRRAVLFQYKFEPGDVYDIRFRKRDTEPDGLGSGLTAWLYGADGQLIEGPKYAEDPIPDWAPADTSADITYPLDMISTISENYATGGWQGLGEFITARIRISSLALSDAEIEGWEGWSPNPLISTEYFHDFSKEYMMPGIPYDRDFPDTTVDYMGNEVTVGDNIPTLAGYRWDGETNQWYEEGVGYGLHLKSDGTYYYAYTSELDGVPSEGLRNNFCLQVTGQWLSTTRGTNGQTFNIGYFIAYPSYNAILSLQTGKDVNNVPSTFVSMNFFQEEVEIQDRSVRFPIELVEGQTFDIRVRKRSTEPDGLGSGVTAWMYVHDTNGTTTYGPFQGADSGTPAVCSQDFLPPMNILDWAGINNSETTIAERYIAQVRIYPGTLSDAEIEAWPTWMPPEGT